VGTGFAFRTINASESGTSLSSGTIFSSATLIANPFGGNSMELLDAGSTVAARIAFPLFKARHRTADSLHALGRNQSAGSAKRSHLSAGRELLEQGI
jgi:hypothetical protein